jgi:DoxX-like family
MKILYYISLGLTTLVFLSAGGMKAVGAVEMHARMSEMHYSSIFTYLLGISEVLGVIGLFFNNTRIAVVLYFLAIIFGGIGSHIAAGHGMDRLGFALIGLLALLLLLFTNKKVNGTSFAV